ncbi:MAG: hypothetical protein AVDCRST_MAG10-1234, partial [uncultured Acidimicrobiales bacterium]
GDPLRARLRDPGSVHPGGPHRGWLPGARAVPLESHRQGRPGGRARRRRRLRGRLLVGLPAHGARPHRSADVALGVDRPRRRVPCHRPRPGAPAGVSDRDGGRRIRERHRALPPTDRRAAGALALVSAPAARVRPPERGCRGRRRRRLLAPCPRV